MEEQRKLIKLLPSITIILFGLSVHFKMLFSDGALINEVSKVLMAVLGLGALIYTVYVHRSKKFYMVIGIYTIFIFLSSIFSGNYRFNDYILIYMYLGISLMTASFKFSYKMILMNFIFYSLFFIIFIQMQTDGRVYMSVSRNYNSIMMIYNAILYYITAYQQNRRLRISPAIITFIISLLSIGRSGIISSAVLLLGVSVMFIQDNLKLIEVKRRYVIFSILAISITGFFFITQLSHFLRPYVERLIQNGIHDDVRTRLIKEYAGNASIDLRSFLFGVPIRGNLLFERWGYNLHNSYLRLHSLFGLGGLISFLGLLGWSSLYYLKNNKLYFVLSVVVFLRISTDTAAFYGILDPMIFFLLLNNFFRDPSTVGENVKNIVSYNNREQQVL